MMAIVGRLGWGLMFLGQWCWAAPCLWPSTWAPEAWRFPSPCAIPSVFPSALLPARPCAPCAFVLLILLTRGLSALPPERSFGRLHFRPLHCPPARQPVRTRAPLPSLAFGAFYKTRTLESHRQGILRIGLGLVGHKLCISAPAWHCAASALFLGNFRGGRVVGQSRRSWSIGVLRCIMPLLHTP